MSNVQCPSCGAQASGRFCRQCGAGLSAEQRCARCGASRPDSARYCPSCGASSTASAGLTGNERLRWFAAGGIVVALAAFGVLALSRDPSFNTAAQQGGASPSPAQAPAPDMPDLASMTPRERFDRLFNRIMRSSETGDEASVGTFAPMALQAYGMLDTVDADARYHAALIMLHTGDMGGARALADTISKQDPGHLFATVVRGTIARFQQDQQALNAAYGEFLKNYDRETAVGRQEYGEHPRALQDFLEAARAAKPKS